MTANGIPLIMEMLAQIVTEEMARKYSTAPIIKIIVILRIYGISYRSSKHFFNNHREFMALLGSSWGYCKWQFKFIHFRQMKNIQNRQMNIYHLIHPNNGDGGYVFSGGLAYD